MARCKLPDCPISKDGRCLEGRKETCPNLIPDDVSTDEPEVAMQLDDAARSATRPMESLNAGLPLEIAEAREFTRASRAVLVTLAGMKECGKTSLIARLHQQFQGGPVGDYQFAGSRTLFRFEEMNWRAMLDSGATSPAMERSSRQFNNALLHVKVRKKSSDEAIVDVLLNDVAGETFPDLIAVEGLCEQLLCLRRADHLAVLIDGASIASRDSRYDHFAKIRNFVQRLLQTGQIGKPTVLHLIISKQDALKSEDEAINTENLEAAEKLKKDFTKLFTSKVGKIHVWQLAARPDDGSMPTEETISQLFTTWVSTSCRLAPLPTTSSEAARPVRDFCNFGETYTKK
jgi:hypothetical protein